MENGHSWRMAREDKGMQMKKGCKERRTKKDRQIKRDRDKEIQIDR